MSDDKIASGTIRTKIRNLDKWRDHQQNFSTPTTVAGVPWRLVVESEKSDRTNNVRHLGTFLYCNDTSTMRHRWSVHCEITFRLIAQDGSSRTHTFESTRIYDNDNCKSSWGWNKFISWTDLMKKSNPWVRNNSTEVEVRFVVTKLEGIDYPLEAPFSSSTEFLTDVVLLIDGRRLHVNKTLLSIHSPVFMAMFFGQYAERSLEEIPIRGVDYNELVIFLRAIYPTRQCIDDSNVEAILKLADFYDIQNLVRDCEQFLGTHSALSKEKKLQLADKFRLSALLSYSANLYSTVEELDALKLSDEYAHLSSDSKKALNEKCLRVTKKQE